MLPKGYIIIAGNIGTGKTTTVELLKDTISDCVIFTETRDIYLERFYKDPREYAFLNQMAYSLQYLEQAVSISREKCLVVQDRSIYDTHEVFSRMFLEDGFIDTDQFGLLERVVRASHRIAQPSLLVLLDADVEVSYSRLKHRAIPAEMAISKSYLRRLRKEYQNWYETSQLPKVKISTNAISPEKVVEEVIRNFQSKR